MKKFLIAVAIGSLSVFSASSQVLLSGGLTYSQNFDSLSNATVGTSYTWTDNATPGLVGWYASRTYTGGTTSAYGPYAYTGYRVGDGTANNGTLWSFGIAGVNPVTDRALGTISSGTPKTNVFGVRIQNDTAGAVNNVLVSYTGEQWRNGAPTTLAFQTLAFSYQVSASPFSSPISDLNTGWTPVSALNFVSPITGGSAGALDGNAPANRTVFSGVLLTGVTLNPGEEIFLRWQDIDDTSNDHGFGVDDFSVSFSAVPEPAVATLGGLAALGLVMWRRCRR